KRARNDRRRWMSTRREKRRRRRERALGPPVGLAGRVGQVSLVRRATSLPDLPALLPVRVHPQEAERLRPRLSGCLQIRAFTSGLIAKEAMPGAFEHIRAV